MRIGGGWQGVRQAAGGIGVGVAGAPALFGEAQLGRSESAMIARRKGSSFTVYLLDSAGGCEVFAQAISVSTGLCGDVCTGGGMSGDDVGLTL